jgi:hypothetical protein
MHILSQNMERRILIHFQYISLPTQTGYGESQQLLNVICKIWEAISKYSI